MRTRERAPTLLALIVALAATPAAQTVSVTSEQKISETAGGFGGVLDGSDGFGITAACRRYLAPLIAGEDYPPYRDGLPVYVKIRGKAVKKKLVTSFKV